MEYDFRNEKENRATANQSKYMLLYARTACLEVLVPLTSSYCFTSEKEASLNRGKWSVTELKLEQLCGGKRYMLGEDVIRQRQIREPLSYDFYSRKSQKSSHTLLQ